jgi:hypothetical protein
MVYVKMEAEIGVMCFDDETRGFKPTVQAASRSH